METTIYLSPNTFVEPDLVVYPRGIKLEEVKGSDILLAIEMALTSLPYDRGLKARLMRDTAFASSGSSTPRAARHSSIGNQRARAGDRSPSVVRTRR